MSVDTSRLQSLAQRLDPVINAISARRVSASNAVLAVGAVVAAHDAVVAVMPNANPIADDWLQLLVDAATQDLDPYVQQLERLAGIRPAQRAEAAAATTADVAEAAS